jgi:hypothetical protein
LRLADPRSAVLLVLVAVVAVGVARKWLQAAASRRAVERLADPGVTPAEVEATALARLWAGDQLVVEEEKAVATRGYAVTWHARRRYPRAMRRPIPIGVTFGIPFLAGGPGRLGPGQLEWSYRIAGAGRASLETFGEWRPGPPDATFEVEPDDFATNGPHRLALQARVRPVGLTSAWELDLPHVAFSFEFDPRLAVESLWCAPDEARDAEIARAVRLVREESASGPTFLPLGDGLALRDPPRLEVAGPLPCDLAHEVSLEFDGIADAFPAGQLVAAGQASGGSAIRRWPPGRVDERAGRLLGRPGARRMRAILNPDPEAGWADPVIRAAWPRPITTDWCDVQVVRL